METKLKFTWEFVPLAFCIVIIKEWLHFYFLPVFVVSVSKLDTHKGKKQVYPYCLLFKLVWMNTEEKIQTLKEVCPCFLWMRKEVTFNK